MIFNLINSRIFIRCILLHAIFLFLVVPAIYGAEFYVSPHGKDTNSGSEHHPFATIERARDAVRNMISKSLKENVHIYIREGIYRIDKALSFDPRDSGSKKFSIVYMAFPGEKPVISGGLPIKNWLVRKDGTWQTELSDRPNFRELFVNGNRAQRARFPKHGYLRVLQAGEDRMSQFTFNSGDIPKEATGAGMELVFFHDWSISRIPIKEIDHTNNIIYPAAKIGRQHFMMVIDGYEKHPRFYLENHPAFCDTAGEWYLSPSNTLTYIPRDHEEIGNVSAITPIARQLLIIQGEEDTTIQNLHFEGLIFEHCAFSLPPNGYAGIQAAHYSKYTGEDMSLFVEPAVQLKYTENSSFSECVFRHLGGSGVLIGEGCVNCRVNSCNITDISGNGIMIGENSSRLIEGKPWWQMAAQQAADGNTLTNCLIENCGIQFLGAVGIWVGLAHGTVISHNEICNLPYTGISIGWMWNPKATPCHHNISQYNNIHHVMKELSDGGGIYTLGMQPGTVLHHNLIHDVTVNIGRAESNGMFLDEGTTDIVIQDNVIYKIGRSPLRFNRAGENIVRKNILEVNPDTPVIRYNNTKEENIHKIENTIIKFEVQQVKILEKAIQDLQLQISSGS